jgi:uncharacterized protein
VQLRSFPKVPGLRVSVLGFGCMRLPTRNHDVARIDEDQATSLLREAIEGGVNYVDTAYPYHAGASEPFVGRALAGPWRARVQLATKLPVWLVTKESDWERLLDEQLRRLATDRIDFYLLHALDVGRWDTVRRLHGLAAMERAKADGRIGHLGFSFHDSLDCFKTIVDGYDAWEFCQIQYNFLDAEYQAGTAGLEHAAKAGLGVVVMEPLRGGGITRDVPDAVQRIWARAKTQRSPAEWALRWVLNRPEVVTVLSGMNSRAQLTENLACAEAARAGLMTAEELALIGEVATFYHGKTKVPCTTCGYCEPCPSGVAIPDVFSMYNSSAMFDAKAPAATLYQNLLVRAGCGADACTECRACEAKCPQGIAIAEKLKEAHAALTTP